MREIGIAFTTSFSGKCKGKDEINSGEQMAFRRERLKPYVTSNAIRPMLEWLRSCGGGGYVWKKDNNYKLFTAILIFICKFA